MRVLLSGGGTGGHVYPILAVLERLKAQGVAPLQTLYLGSQEGLEREIIPREGIAYRAVATASLVGSQPWRLPRQMARILQGTAQAWGIVRSFRPQAILATGGYVCVPAVVAGWLQGIPALLYLPDIEPGLAVRFLAPLAKRIAVSFPESQSFFPAGKTTVTGYPVRSAIWREDKLQARKALGLSLEEKVLLVMGGSRGAQRINLAISHVLPRLLANCLVLHISGQADFDRLQKLLETLPAEMQGRYRLQAYLYQEMPQALVAADLALARSGASVLGEFPSAGLPSILVPYPFAHRHQERNARYLAGHGASLVLDEEDLEEKLPAVVSKLFQDDSQLRHMAQRARSLAQPDAAQKLGDEFLRMILQGERN